MKRRGFLSLLATTPIAAPVAAKEAAGKMGLAGSLGGVVDQAPMPSGPRAVEISPSGDGSWVHEHWTEFWSDQGRRDRMQQTKHHARVLDPDIASMRSVSASAAFTIQRARALRTIEENELSWFERQSKRFGLSLFKGKA